MDHLFHWTRAAFLTLSASLLGAFACAGPEAENEASAADTARLALANCTSDDPTCNPAGGHSKHSAFECRTCHSHGAIGVFAVGGLAWGPPEMSPPSYDSASKTCSNIACHTVLPGTFTYYFQGGDGEAEARAVNYGTFTPPPTPGWYRVVPACTACHANPPPLGSSGSNVWHSGQHGNQGPTGTNNQCQLCHPDASGTNGVGTTITDPTLHGNGAVDVQGRFRSSCFGCH